MTYSEKNPWTYKKKTTNKHPKKKQTTKKQEKTQTAKFADWTWAEEVNDSFIYIP